MSQVKRNTALDSSRSADIGLYGEVNTGLVSNVHLYLRLCSIWRLQLWLDFHFIMCWYVLSNTPSNSCSGFGLKLSHCLLCKLYAIFFVITQSLNATTTITTIVVQSITTQSTWHYLHICNKQFFWT